ncbi:MAG: serine/threonine protein kinase [Myxococcales bacterium]|nr:serine/threonine protein kinase [Myxococcales bacterium]
MASTRFASAPDGDARARPLAQIARYRVETELGRGGMGVVYRAYDPDLDRAVALKLIKAVFVDDEARARFLREAQAMARLQHPNVVAVHDVGLDDDSLFIAMDFVEGSTLDAWLRAAPRTVQQRLDVLVAAGRGLAAAHAAGLVHRDFKPANVLVGTDGRPRILDFGLVHGRGHDDVADAPTETSQPSTSSLLTDELTRVGSFMGTPAYMSPEQYFDAGVGDRSDQFSFFLRAQTKALT